MLLSVYYKGILTTKKCTSVDRFIVVVFPDWWWVKSNYWSYKMLLLCTVFMEITCPSKIHKVEVGDRFGNSYVK